MGNKKGGFNEFMTVIVYFKKPFIKKKYENIISFIDNGSTCGLGSKDRPIYIKKELIRKVVFKGAKN